MLDTQQRPKLEHYRYFPHHGLNHRHHAVTMEDRLHADPPSCVSSPPSCDFQLPSGGVSAQPDRHASHAEHLFLCEQRAVTRRTCGCVLGISLSASISDKTFQALPDKSPTIDFLFDVLQRHSRRHPSRLLQGPSRVESPTSNSIRALRGLQFPLRSR